MTYDEQQMPEDERVFQECLGVAILVGTMIGDGTIKYSPKDVREIYAVITELALEFDRLVRETEMKPEDALGYVVECVREYFGGADNVE